MLKLFLKIEMNFNFYRLIQRVSVHVCAREREREREWERGGRERQTDREGETDRQTVKDRHSNREGQTQREIIFYFSFKIQSDD